MGSYHPLGLGQEFGLSFNSYLLFIAAASLLAVTPGPGIFYVAARTSTQSSGWQAVGGVTVP